MQLLDSWVIKFELITSGHVSSPFKVSSHLFWCHATPRARVATSFNVIARKGFHHFHLTLPDDDNVYINLVIYFNWIIALYLCLRLLIVQHIWSGTNKCCASHDRRASDGVKNGFEAPDEEADNCDNRSRFRCLERTENHPKSEANRLAKLHLLALRWIWFQQFFY